MHNRDDNMTLRDVITEKRQEFWKEADTSQMGEELELIIDRIVKIEERLNSLNFNTGVLISSIDASRELPEPFRGYNDLIEETIPLLKAAIAEKKRELDSGPKMERT